MYLCSPPEQCKGKENTPECTPPPDVCPTKVDANTWKCDPSKAGKGGGPPPGTPRECMPPEDPRARENWSPPQWCSQGPSQGGKYCSPDQPCAPRPPPNCTRGTDDTMTCPIPAECQGKIGQTPQCTLPPFCKVDGNNVVCKQGEMGQAAGGPCGSGPSPAASGNGSSQSGQPSPSCSGPQGPRGPPPDCRPNGDGTVMCAPPPGCGGSSFSGGGARGCAPPDFCKQTADGNYTCTPPQDCRGSEAGARRCFAATSAGDGCLANVQQHSNATANGAFAPCAASVQQVCLASNSMNAPDRSQCFAPPPPPRFCGAGENPFPAGTPRGSPPVCMLPPGFQNGTYVPPSQVYAGGCAPPPPGEFPPAQPAPPGKVWCPPMGWAPPPSDFQGDPGAFAAWKRFAEGQVPGSIAAGLALSANGWGSLTPEQRAAMHSRALATGLYGQAEFDGRVTNGTFMGTTADPANMKLQDYRVGGVGFIRGAEASGGDSAKFSTAVGGEVLLAGNNTIIEMHNKASGDLVYRAAGSPYTVNLSLDPQIRVQREGGIVILSNGTWRAAVSGSDVSVGANGNVSFTVKPGQPGVFMASPPSGVENETRLDIARGVASGSIGAEASITSDANGTAVPEVVRYGDVNVTVNKATNTSLAVGVNAATRAGKVVVLTIDRTSLGVSASDLAVTIDNRTLTESSNLTAIVNTPASAPSASENMSDGKYFVTADPTTIRVAVYVPGFSVHEISLASTAQLARQQNASSATPSAWNFSGTSQSTNATQTPTPTPTPTGGSRIPGIGATATGGVAVAVAFAMAAIPSRRRR